MNAAVRVYRDIDELGRGAAEFFLSVYDEAVAKKGYFTAALSGGKTPSGLYALLSADEFRERFDWEKIHLFWGDERCVGPESLESNFRMAADLFLSKLRIPAENIHRIKAELGAEEAARLYEEELMDFFKSKKAVPVFDLMLLGVGTDGHTLSLFPSSPALKERERFVAGNYAEGKGFRVTMTLKAANSSSNIVFLVSGRDKARVIRDIIKNKSKKHPAGMVEPERGDTIWMIDKEAASLL